MPRPLPEAELLEAVDMVRDWSPLRGARIFITGGTGFFGKWLLEVLGTAVQTRKLAVEAVVLSRNPSGFLEAMPHLREQAWLSFHQGEVTSFEPPAGDFSHILHGAASSDARDYVLVPQAMRRAIVEGTRRVMELLPTKATQRVLLLSSGAVYGPQPPGLNHIPEDFPLPADTEDPAQSYAQGKREAERILAEASSPLGYKCPIARCFAFAGPHLPLDQHFAFGNFVRDSLAGGPIRIAGDGTPFRSYLYASEMAAWLFTLLLHGESTTYHVGSDQDVSIRELARTICRVSGVKVTGGQEPAPGVQPARYVPAIIRMVESFQLRQTIGLEEAIVRTMRWHRG